MFTRFYYSRHECFLICRKKWLILWVILLLNACNCAVDSEFFGNSGCTPPCWQHITPGKTIESDALSIVTDPQLIQSESFKEQSTGNLKIQEYSFHLKRTSVGSIGSIRIKNGVVSTIYINPDFDLSLGDLINEFGEPAYLFAREVPGSFVCYDVNLYYPDQGIVVHIFYCYDRWRNSDVPAGFIRLEEETSVESLRYFEPAQSLEEALLNVWFPDEQKTRLIMSNAVDWKGLGVYKATIE